MHALHLTVGSLALAALSVLGLLTLAPERGQTSDSVLLVGLADEPSSLDPHVATASSDFQVATNVYEGLVRFGDDDLEPAPSLARRWTIQKDGKAYTFELEPGVEFHDGTPFDAEAVRFNFERMLDERHPYRHTGPFPLAFFFEHIERVVVVDELTVRLELDQPFAPLLSNLAYPTGFMVSPAAVRRSGKTFGRHPVGTGPFRFLRWDAGQRIVLSRYGEHHAKPAKARTLVFRPIADPMTRVAELSSGGIDLSPELPPDNTAWFRRTSGFSVHETPTPHLWFVIFNTRKPPFDDVRVRRAANLAVNKTAIVEHVLQHTATVAAGPVASAFGDHAGSVEPYPHDPEKARELLAAAGVAGHKLVLLAPQSGSGMLAPMEMATAIQADLGAVGLDVEVRSYEWNTYLAQVNAGLGEAHMAEMAWTTNDPDTLPYLALRSAAHPPHGFNSGWYANLMVDALLESARQKHQRVDRAKLYQRVQQLVHDDAPWLFVASSTQNLVARSNLGGIVVPPSFLIDLRRAYLR